MSAQPSEQQRRIAREAARWLTLLESGEAAARDHGELQRWRENDPAHEQAWQKAQQLRARFGEVPGALAMASLDRPEPKRRALLKRMLVLGAVAPTAWLAYRHAPVDRWRADLRTATGERREMTLADGSLLQLNTASAVNIGAQSLSLVEGEIALRSKGSVAWSVHTRQGSIAASDADICVRQFDSLCRVSVYRGSVTLQPLGRTPLRLEAGQWATLEEEAVGQPQRFDAQQPDWQQGMLIVDAQPLGAFLRELDRYRSGVVRWEPELEALSVTGTFRLADTDRIFDLLAASLPVDVHYRTRYWVSLARRRIQA